MMTTTIIDSAIDSTIDSTTIETSQSPEGEANKTSTLTKQSFDQNYDQSFDHENLSAHADHVSGEEGHPEFGRLKVNFAMPDADFIEDGFVDSKEEVAAAVASLEEFSEEVAAAVGEDVEVFELGAEDNSGSMAQATDTDLIRDTEDLVTIMENIPDKMAFKIGEAADLVGVKQYVLRYWETEFEQLHPKKSKNNQRVYSRRDVETALMIKKLLYTDRFSIEGARSALRNLKNQVKEEKEIKTLAGEFDKACLRVSDLLADIRRAQEVIAAH